MASEEAANLVRRVVSGDVNAYGELVERHRDAVFGLCYHRCGDFEAARDLAQDAFVRAYQHLGQLADPARFPGWLRRIAERVCLDWRRRQRDERPLQEGEEGGQVVDDESAALRATVESALTALPEPQRLAVTLYYINGYSYREIAEFLSVPETTVKARLDGGRDRLRLSLASAFGEALRAQRPPQEFGQEVMMRVTQVQLKQGVNQVTGGPAPTMVLGDEERAIAVCIGEAEAGMMRVALGKHEHPRPMTYDLMLNMLAAFGIRLAGARVADLRENIYFAELELTRGKTTKRVDCRPSDAVNLALRADVPVEVDEAVLTKAGITAEQARLDYGNLPEYRLREPAMPLHLAADAGDAAEVERLLAEGMEPDLLNPSGVTPLRIATMQGHTEVAKLLLAKGADPDGRDAEGRSHLHWASHNGRQAVAALLLAAGAGVNAQNNTGATPLHVATSAEMVAFLLSGGADVHAPDQQGRTPLHYAASQGLTEVARALLSGGAEVSAKDCQGATPLTLAVGAETQALLRSHGGAP